MFEPCQNCQQRPASLHCVTCGSLPRYSLLCYDCDTRIHLQLRSAHRKQYLKADLGSLRTVTRSPVRARPPVKAVYSHTPSPAFIGDWPDKENGTPVSNVQRQTDPFRDQKIGRSSMSSGSGNKGVVVSDLREAGTQTAGKQARLKEKIEAVKRTIAEERERHQLVIEGLMATLPVVSACQHCEFRLNRA